MQTQEITNDIKTKKGRSKVVDCRKNVEFIPCNDNGKVSLRIKELNCYILVDPAKIDTKAKKAAYIANYIEVVNESRKRFADAYTKG